MQNSGGEEVDVFANEIRRLARFEGPYLEHIVKLTFINGLPDYERAATASEEYFGFIAR